MNAILNLTRKQRAQLFIASATELGMDAVGDRSGLITMC